MLSEEPHSHALDNTLMRETSEDSEEFQHFFTEKNEDGDRRNEREFRENEENRRSRSLSLSIYIDLIVAVELTNQTLLRN